MLYDKLYSRRSDGKLQLWSLERVADKFRVHSGIVGGKIVTNEWTVCTGKNIGRANETSPDDQAEAEATALWQKKFDSGYRKTEDELTETGVFEPMLAKKYVDYAEKVSFPVYVQPKLDGIRVIAKPSGLFSRNGKLHQNLVHVAKDLATIFKEHPTLIIDGEGYADKLHNDFNMIVHLIKKQKPSLKDQADSAKVIRYHVYDCFFTDQPNMNFRDRSKKIYEILKDVKSVVIVPTFTVENKQQLDDKYTEFLTAGYEGEMIRTDTPYENKRTTALLKRKEFIDEEFTIQNIEEGIGNRAGMAGAVVLSNGKFGNFNAGIRGDKEYYTLLLKKKKQIIGKLATIRYQNLSPDNIPRFPVMIAIREEYE